MQLWTPVSHGYWHAQQLTFTMTGTLSTRSSGSAPRRHRPPRRRRRPAHGRDSWILLAHRNERELPVLPRRDEVRARSRWNLISIGRFPLIGGASSRPGTRGRSPRSRPSSRPTLTSSCGWSARNVTRATTPDERRTARTSRRSRRLRRPPSSASTSRVLRPEPPRPPASKQSSAQVVLDHRGGIDREIPETATGGLAGDEHERHDVGDVVHDLHGLSSPSRRSFRGARRREATT